MGNLTIYNNLIWSSREVFRFPDAEIYKEQQAQILELLDYAQKMGWPTGQEWKQKILKEDIDWEALQVDYTGLFINGYPQAWAHPFSGWYLGDGFLFGRSEMEMREFYSRYGIIMERTEDIPADHIIVELEFLYIMLEGVRLGNSDFLPACQEMLDHMNRWVFTFLESIQQGAREEYYRLMARVISSVLHDLKECVKEVA